MQFQVTPELIEKIQHLASEQLDQELHRYLKDLHHADIAEIIAAIPPVDAAYIIRLLDSEKTAEILMELYEDDREQILLQLSPQEIAGELDMMDTDDAADFLAELPDEIKGEVIDNIEDDEHAKDLQELLRYDEDSAGGLMAKELIRVREDWPVSECIDEIRRQAENVIRVHSIYVVDKDDKLIGRLSVKDLLTVKSQTKIAEIYIPRVDYVNVHTDGDEVARVMQKYDLEALPVVDEIGKLVGRITIDDIVDFIKEEAEKDYQLAAGISQDVDTNDSFIKQTRARLPWLLLALVGSFVAVLVIGEFDTALERYSRLFFFTPLIAAMAGNVGVQSSAIIVQSIANNTLSDSLSTRLFKELLLSFSSGLLLSLLLLFATHFILNYPISLAITIALSLIIVMIIASLVGTFVPITLHRMGIDPALATGPFITTSNDIFGIFIFFSIARVILEF
ncbi:magnesium transporter [Ostreibacterium oceani]|uniref:Magnesium transporter MgtE n=1 Tax=Ostreibacterium oceani TaxID=2654998 RepID=A0A6N7EWG0_9GAMM|nr:magnesium transporter [Ostreibacterium oceani]MPV85447.1 magnesium transporter [Ostreibacterium oceani]